ncbi:MAG: hypothetical protein QME78_10595 [Thermodesulfobacteriota bacterium]|nr:hypothetical protein [Thermodesulfobacteriota bacterium]
MKAKFIFSLLAGLVLILFQSANAGNYGAPEPLARPSSVSLGIGYSYFVGKIEIDSQLLGTQKHKFEQNQVYAQLNAAYQNAEGYIRIGGAGFRVDDIFITSSPGFTLSGFKNDFKDDSTRAFAAGGAKVKLDINPYFSLGPFLQASIYDDYKDSTTGTMNGVQTKQEVEIAGSYKVDVGLFLQAKINPVIFYAGPFICWFRGEVRSTRPLPGLSDKFKETGAFGGAAGLRINLFGGLNIELEAQYSEKLSAGGFISYAF